MRTAVDVVAAERSLYQSKRDFSRARYDYIIETLRLKKAAGSLQPDRAPVGGEYRRCQNDRIQNVFGGVSSAGFVANEDMQRRCSGPNSLSMDELRRDIFSKIVDGVLKVPPIKIAHEMN